MSTSGATTADTSRTGDRDRGKTPAQWFAYLVGAVLVLIGVLGFISDATFDTGGDLQGDGFLGFEVNGWHNLVHIASGLFLLAIAPKRKTAKTGVLIFGVLYAIVTIIGLIDGNDVLGFIPVNPADNILHLVLSAAAILAALASDGDDHHHDSHRGTTSNAATTTERRVVAEPRTDDARVGTDSERLFPKDRNEVR